MIDLLWILGRSKDTKKSSAKVYFFLSDITGWVVNIYHDKNKMQISRSASISFVQKLYSSS